MIQQKRRIGNVAPFGHASGPARRLAAVEAVIRVAVKAQPDATLQELCERVKKETGIKSDSSMMCQALARWKLPRKKVAPCYPTGDAEGEVQA